MPSEIAKDMLSIDAFSAPLNSSGTNTENDIVKTAINMQPTVVQLQVGSEYGSGSIISIKSEKIYILTAAHVIKKWNDTDSHYAIFFNGKVADTELIASDDYYDAAIVAVNTNDLESFDLMNLRAVDIDTDAISYFDKQKNQIVIALDSDHKVNAKKVQKYDYYGNESGIGYKYVYGSVINPNILVTDYGYKMIYVKCDAHSGMSGGGVFDIYGNYVGILVGGTPTGEMVAVRLSDIEALLETM